MKLTLLLSALLLVNFQAMAFDPTGEESIKSGRSDYYCTMSVDNPTRKDLPGQLIFEGGAFIGSSSDSVIVTRNGQVIVKPLEKLSPAEIQALTGSTFISLAITPDKGPKLELSRNLIINITTIQDLQKIKRPEDLLAYEVAASGYYKGRVIVHDEERRIMVACFHKGQLPTK